MCLVCIVCWWSCSASQSVRWWQWQQESSQSDRRPLTHYSPATATGRAEQSRAEHRTSSARESQRSAAHRIASILFSLPITDRQRTRPAGVTQRTTRKEALTSAVVRHTISPNISSPPLPSSLPYVVCLFPVSDRSAGAGVATRPHLTRTTRTEKKSPADQVQRSRTTVHQWSSHIHNMGVVHAIPQYGHTQRERATLPAANAQAETR